MPPLRDSESLLTSTEPNLRFSVAAVEFDSLVLRVHLSLESVAGRPGAGEEAPYAFDAYSVPLRHVLADFTYSAYRGGVRRGRSTQCERPRGAQAR
jgi:hypothetical protein